ncbi:TatD family hydrolase [Desulfobotulus sp.]|jgi:TatD DNase family protein|uniref:TatD family hydrolase n=1 Tax=Desulfobotulus sp. TaxID=1940337 RepID=UPI002A359C56|nr:TatD family hydrolase [Desulfobotulus sp.]MDY0164070.1 TatD family hydrolase [Desulfobotulus sp.]
MPSSEKSRRPRLVDTHCHLQDDRITNALSSLLLEARAAGVGYFVCCGAEEDDWDRVRILSLSHEGVVPFFGLHPFYVETRSLRWDLALGDLLSAMPDAGVGEVGLDGMAVRHSLEEQEKVLITQLRLARDLKRPLSLHCRKAWGRMLGILKKEGGLPHGGAFHAWSGSPDMVPEVEKLGAYIGFAGSLTRMANRKVARSALVASPDRILIETDAPDIPPEGVESQMNEPAWLIRTFDALARIRNLADLALAEQLFRNSQNFLSFLSGVRLLP